MNSLQVLKLNLTVSDKKIEEGARQVIQRVKPEWDIENLKYKVFTDGITNKLLGCYPPGEFDNLVLVRVNGHGSDLTVNRDGEPEVLQTLHAAGCAPPVHCFFENGMAYGFFPGKPLDEKSVRLPNIQRKIAEEMVRLHKVRLPSFEKANEGKKPISQYAAKMHRWLDSAPTSFDDPNKQKVFEKEIPSKDALRQELNEIVAVLDAEQMEVVFSHNDLLLKNIIYNDNEDTIRFIDYEYSFYNYEAFDIGNHFTEYAGMDEVDYNLYPNKEEQLPWLRHYLEAKVKSSGSEIEVTDKDVERLYIQVNKCACASHFLWGTWALIQAEHSAIAFDYVAYSKIRLTEYFRRKEEFFKLTL